jgi:predicted ATPase with chaperone activity
MIITVETELPTPLEPESLEQTGLPESLVEQLVLKILYFRGELFGQDLSHAIGLKFSVIQELVETLILQHLVVVKRSIGMGNVSALLTLSEAGRGRTREYLEANTYSGRAPVPLEQYTELVKKQRPKSGWLSKEALRQAFRGMVITERLLSQVGPAVSAGSSLLIYGKPGDGKTFLMASLNNLDAAKVFVPYALECQGNIIQVYDPVYHERVEEDAPSVMAVSVARSIDRRWLKCRRPFIVTGGELTLDMLDLRFNRTSKVYEAPFQLKANNGIYLIDDFGRQRATPTEVLNRWIVPMDRKVDYLSFLSGGKMTVPFETFLAFSTNLNPASFGDEAFLRRIQYKLLMRGPAVNEFVKIFEEYCLDRRIPCPDGVLPSFIERHYTRTGKPFRRCHPRDVLTHAVNLLNFEKLPLELTDQILDRAFDSCFLSEEDSPVPAEAAILPSVGRTCLDHWAERGAWIATTFGCVYYLASFRDFAAGGYRDEISEQEFGVEETSRTLAVMHHRAFQAWMQLTLDQQRNDFQRFLRSAEGSTSDLTADRTEGFSLLAPVGAAVDERARFVNNLAAILSAEAPRAEVPEAAVNRSPAEQPVPGA